MSWTADKRYCLTADGRVVADDDPEARTLLIGEGSQMPLADAKRYGLTKGTKDGDTDTAPDANAEPDAQPDTEPDAKSVTRAPANKAISGPGATKASDAPASGGH